MKTTILAGVAALAIAGSTAVYAQHRPWSQHQGLTAQDKVAFADARIAAVHAGLQLSPDQEKMWPAVESAVRDFAKLRIDRADARMQQRQNNDDARDRPPQPDDPIARLQRRGEMMASTGTALKRIAEAADPLYKSLDDGQKRRLAMLTHMGRFGGGEGWQRHRGDENDGNRGDGDRRGDRAFERGDRNSDFDRGSDRDGNRDRGNYQDQEGNRDRSGDRDRGGNRDRGADRDRSSADRDRGADQDRSSDRDRGPTPDRGPAGDFGPQRERM